MGEEASFGELNEYQKITSGQFEDKQTNAQNPFLPYQLAGYYDSNQQYEQSQRPAFNRPIPRTPSLTGSDGLPVQGTGQGETLDLPPVQIYTEAPTDSTALMLARQQANGQISSDMVALCDQIWADTHNPRAINQLLAEVNRDFQQMGLPYSFGQNIEFPPPGAPRGTAPRMSIYLADVRNTRYVQRAYLQ